jgi:hypothetical protein
MELRLVSKCSRKALHDCSFCSSYTSLAHVLTKSVGERLRSGQRLMKNIPPVKNNIPWDIMWALAGFVCGKESGLYRRLIRRKNNILQLPSLIHPQRYLPHTVTRELQMWKKLPRIAQNVRQNSAEIRARGVSDEWTWVVIEIGKPINRPGDGR